MVYINADSRQNSNLRLNKMEDVHYESDYRSPQLDNTNSSIEKKRINHS